MESLLKQNNNFDFSLAKTLSNTLIYNDCLKMIIDIGNQIEFLNKNNFGVLHLKLKDIFLDHFGFTDFFAFYIHLSAPSWKL